MRRIVRYERHGDELVALCENDNGDRWYILISKGGEVTF
jgi:hypothetical protein